MTTTLNLYLTVGLGSALGGMGRLWLTSWMARRFGEAFPWGTLLVNVSGSFLIGLFVALSTPDGRSLARSQLGPFFMAGLCGGYTTFSSFSLQTLNLARDGHWLLAGGNIVLSVTLCLLAVGAGYLAGHVVSR